MIQSRPNNNMNSRWQPKTCKILDVPPDESQTSWRSSLLTERMERSYRSQIKTNSIYDLNLGKGNSNLANEIIKEHEMENNNTVSIDTNEIDKAFPSHKSMLELERDNLSPEVVSRLISVLDNVRDSHSGNVFPTTLTPSEYKPVTVTSDKNQVKIYSGKCASLKSKPPRKIFGLGPSPVNSSFELDSKKFETENEQNGRTKIKKETTSHSFFTRIATRVSKIFSRHSHLENTTAATKSETKGKLKSTDI